MEPSTAMFDIVVYPTVLFEDPLPSNRPIESPSEDWSDSYLNPKNRPNSLTPSPTSTWRIDGAEKDGTRFFAIPSFSLGKRPLRIDVYIPDESRQPQLLRDLLQSKSLLLVESSQVASLPITQHILRALDAWSSNSLDFEKEYMDMPFGSQIIVETIASDVRNMRIHLVPNYEVERQWLESRKLREIWKMPQSDWPDVINLEDIQFRKQLHDSITLVSIKTHPSELFVFKSLVQNLKYMYHELKVLLTMDSHPNIVSRPLYLVEKKCCFGNKVGICGFILEYYPLGNAREAVCARSRANTLELQGQVRWARQITSALIQIRDGPLGFYSNLELDNILLSSRDSNVDAILIDFEQRSGSYAWSPPEINYMEHLEYLATSKITPSTRQYYAKLVKRYASEWNPAPKSTKYDGTQQIYSSSWLALTTPECEKAQVYMLGKLLWCIFEGVGTPKGIITVDSMKEDIWGPTFPEFYHTPVTLRDCIKRCTSGAPEWRGRYHGVVRRGNKLFPRGKTAGGYEASAAADETKEAAKAWWSRTLRDGENFLEARKRRREGIKGFPGDDRILAFQSERPSLEDVLRELGRIEA